MIFSMYQEKSSIEPDRSAEKDSTSSTSSAAAPCNPQLVAAPRTASELMFEWLNHGCIIAFPTTIKGQSKATKYHEIDMFECRKR
jgi:hypothetical protein